MIPQAVPSPEPRLVECARIAVALAALFAGQVVADSSTPLLASYYDRHLAICGGVAYEWSGEAKPARSMRDVVQVGVGRSDSYALTKDGRLVAWDDDGRAAETLLEGVRYFAAGASGVLAVKADGTLWHVTMTGRGVAGKSRREIVPIATGVKAAAVGDGTDYYVTTSGELFAKGNAHRGQYGDGRLETTDTYVRVATGAMDIKAHTGHAILLTDVGEVRGTGGNLYGPLGRHGLGDKAVRWGTLFEAATGIATGASHSVAVRADGTLWLWGRNESPDPRQVLSGIVGAAAGSSETIALARDGSLWQWRTGTEPVRRFACAP